MEKQRIAQRFSKAIATYNREGFVQQQIALQLVQMLKEKSVTGFTQIAEVGCGTGFLSRELINQFMPSKLWLNDLCPAFSAIYEQWPNVCFESGDIEQLSIPTELDLITSSSTIHWLDNPELFFKKCHAALRPNGWIAFSSFGPKTYHEIRQLTGQGLCYHTIAEYSKMLKPLFDIITLTQEDIVTEFISPSDVLQHLKKTGVTATGNYTWTRGKLTYFAKQYQQLYSTPKGVGLTYQPIYIIGKSKNL